MPWGIGCSAVPGLTYIIGSFLLLVYDVSSGFMEEVIERPRRFDANCSMKFAVWEKAFLEHIPLHTVGGGDLNSLSVE